MEDLITHIESSRKDPLPPPPHLHFLRGDLFFSPTPFIQELYSSLNGEKFITNILFLIIFEWFPFTKYATPDAVQIFNFGFVNQ